MVEPTKHGVGVKFSTVMFQVDVFSGPLPI